MFVPEYMFVYHLCAHRVKRGQLDNLEQEL